MACVVQVIKKLNDQKDTIIFFYYVFQFLIMSRICELRFEFVICD